MQEIRKMILWVCIILTVAIAQKITATNFWIGAAAYILPVAILMAFFDLKKDRPSVEPLPAPKNFGPKIVEIKGGEMPEDLKEILKGFLNDHDHKDHDHAVHKVTLRTCDDPNCKNCKGAEQKKK